MGFDGTKVDPLRAIDLSIIVAKRMLKENFVLVEIHSSYNLIMGRGWIHRMNGVLSTFHQVMRCLSPDGKEVINLWGNQVTAKECYMLTQNEVKKSSLPKYLKAEDEAKAAKPTKESLEAAKVILSDPQKVSYIGRYTFVWDHPDIVGINLSVSCHSLKVDPAFKPVKQKRRRFAPERNRIIAEEVNKLLQAGFIQEVHYPQWLSNVVVV
ncbi:uncharacterized protein LOC132270208 [Cornus florida]|uniref:uncharacterized protein LOC132270208 n=1 Tax=Cornus florida TaxID=4283 RepID=UPI00289DBAAA|nr:uncharacterized protein LOC132270208 [Cornus florida]